MMKKIFAAILAGADGYILKNASGKTDRRNKKKWKVAHL